MKGQRYIFWGLRGVHLENDLLEGGTVGQQNTEALYSLV